MTDYSSPALHLASLTPEELYILLRNLRHVFASGDQEQYLVPDDALESFLNHCHQNIGESYFRTPRSIIKAFLDMLSIVDQNPQIQWSDLVANIELEPDLPSDVDTEIDVNEGAQDSQDPPSNDDGLAGFKI